MTSHTPNKQTNKQTNNQTNKRISKQTKTPIHRQKDDKKSIFGQTDKLFNFFYLPLVKELRPNSAFLFSRAGI